MAVYFASACLWQPVTKLKKARIFKRHQLTAHKILEPFSGVLIPSHTISQCHHCTQCHAPVGKLVRHHRAFNHIFMFIQTALDFKRPDPLARNFDQIVSTSLKIKIAVALDKPVACVDPAITHGFGRLVAATPVTGGG